MTEAAPKQEALEPFIDTYSGGYFYFHHPEASKFTIEDIAHSLSMQCRYSGHSHGFISVAEHSVKLALYVEQHKDHTVQDAYLTLMHDASEAFLGDVAQPLKRLLLDYQSIEHNVEMYLAEKFKFAYPFPAWLKEYDCRVLHDEKAYALPLSSSNWNLPFDEGLGIRVNFWEPAIAKKAFLKTFERLCARMSAEKNAKR